MPGCDTLAPLAPVTATLRAMFGTDDLPGLAPGLVVADEFGWSPASTLVDGSRLPELLHAATLRWGGTPHACAALAWKAYSYWAALPAVLGWAAARRVPLLDPADVLIHFEDHRPLVTLGLRRSTPVAVLPTDPLALSGRPKVRVVADEAALLAVLRASLLDAHLAPLITAIQAEVRIGTRTLLGSVASGVAQAVLRATDALPGSATASVDTLLGALDLADLVELVPGPGGRPTVQRRTCCLAFTLPRPKICQGCCVRPA
ncbi:ferric iron reductase [Micromonospora siamensis]|uniref:Ferric iron reductase FhuF-like transporter n=1 Tax=Micromonospora siamensis TaxID=299152 RepID=A0A1C5GSD1_9ACTN|nr:ferric iron reductase [Micromonospora siamensis]SCG36670.1 Ferric iron reductase FhuF-like transporter [Micromonospora siamensis]